MISIFLNVLLGTDDNLYIASIDVAQNDDIYVGTHGSSVWKGTTHGNVINTVNANSDKLLPIIFPNPCSTNITIEFDEGMDGNLEIFDMLGRKIVTLTLNHAHRTNFNMAQIVDGIYSVVLNTGKKNFAQKLIVHH